MPIPNRVSDRTFAQRFQAAKSDILDYFHIAWDVTRQVAEFNKSCRTPAAKRRPRRRIGRLMLEISVQRQIALSSVHQLRKCGWTFSRQWLDGFLDACRAAEYLPCRETLIALASVSRDQREQFARLAIEQRWSAEQLKLERKRCLGRRSRGGRKRQLPRSLDEAQSRLRETQACFGAISKQLERVHEGVACPPADVPFRVPRAVWEQAKSIRADLARFEASLAACDGKSVT